MQNLYKIVLFLFLSFSVMLNAQVNITIDSASGGNVSGAEITIDTTTSDEIGIPHLYVTNNSGSTQNWVITRKIINQPNDWYNYLCWGQLCYAASPLEIWSTSSAVTMNDTEYKELSIYVNAPTAGSAHYRYYVSTDEVTYQDSVDVKFTTTATVGINTIENLEISIFPNPTQNKLTIVGLDQNEYNLSAYSMTGQLVFLKENFKSNNIDVSQLENGLYTFIISNKQSNQFITKSIGIEK